jgi:hypothetical protein
VLDPATIAGLAAAGLVGLEVDHRDHGPADRVELHALADQLGLVATGSSDYHGSGKVAHELGCETTPPGQLARLLERAGTSAERARSAGANPPPLPSLSL